MRPATKKDKILVEHIVTESFRDNPNINYMIRPLFNKETMIKRLADYAFEFALKRDGIFITSDAKGLVICCHQPIKMDAKDYFNLFKLIISALNLRKLINIFRRDAYIKSVRPVDKKGIYIWCLAVPNQARNNKTAVEIKNFVFEKANQTQSPIYVETALWQNKIVFERYGFETYHYWESASYKLKTWFLKKKAHNFLLSETNYLQ